MSIRKRADREHAAHLQGTLDLLILRTLIFGAQHGQGIACAIQAQSGDVLIVDHGSLYPALQRLEDRGLISAEWGTSENNRKARFYTLTKAGRRELTHEESEWRKIAAAIMRVLGPATEKGAQRPFGSRIPPVRVSKGRSPHAGIPPRFPATHRG